MNLDLPLTLPCPFPGIPGATLRDGSCSYRLRPDEPLCPVHGPADDLDDDPGPDRGARHRR